ncbi:hypothetical protein F5B17DRAFT_371758 [Nemania serpens]|nr:hypothetical protein F5B17DRAFT_371758 [Nemania serpens]
MYCNTPDTIYRHFCITTEAPGLHSSSLLSRRHDMALRYDLQLRYAMQYILYNTPQRTTLICSIRSEHLSANVYPRAREKPATHFQIPHLPRLLSEPGVVHLSPETKRHGENSELPGTLGLLYHQQPPTANKSSQTSNQYRHFPFPLPLVSFPSPSPQDRTERVHFLRRWGGLRNHRQVERESTKTRERREWKKQEKGIIVAR